MSNVNPQKYPCYFFCIFKQMFKFASWPIGPETMRISRFSINLSINLI